MVKLRSRKKDSEIENATTMRALRLPILFFGVGTIFSLAIFFVLIRNEYQSIRQIIQSEQQSVKTEIRLALESRVNSIERMAMRFERRPQMQKSEWEADAFGIYRHLPGFQALEYADQKHIVRWTHPVIGNQAAINLNIASEVTRKVILKQSIAEKTPLIASPLDLKQGGPGFIVFYPMFQKERLLGHMLGVFRADSFFNSISLRENMFITVVDQGTSLYSNEIRREGASEWKMSDEFSFLNLAWNMDFVPTRKFIDSRKTITPFLVLGAGIIFSLLAAWILHLVNQRLEVEKQLAEERKLNESRLKAKQEELARSNAELEQFAYVASHDLKAPLRAVDNLSTWICEDIKKGQLEELPRKTQLMQGRISRMEKLLEDLLQYSRATRKLGEIESIDSKTFIETSVKNLLNPPDQFTLEFSTSMPKIRAYRNPFERVFINLIGNAIKHSEGPRCVVKVSCQEAGDLFEFSISDNGPGIPVEYRDKVFEMFKTLKSRDQVEGSGMGLAMVKKIVEFSGGRVWIDSGNGQGTTFVLTWPKTVSARKNYETPASVSV